MNRFAKFSWIVLACNVLDILWGAFVRATGSGAGCGNHWPACNGEIIPTSQAIATVIEFTHRILSGVALLLVLVLLIWGWRKYAKGSPVRIGVIRLCRVYPGRSRAGGWVGAVQSGQHKQLCFKSCCCGPAPAQHLYPPGFPGSYCLVGIRWQSIFLEKQRNPAGSVLASAGRNCAAGDERRNHGPGRYVVPGQFPWHRDSPRTQTQMQAFWSA